MTSRRKFMSNLATGSVLLAAAPHLSFGREGKNKLEKIGYISNMVKNELQEMDWKAVLKKIVKLGFTEYEGSMQGASPGEFISYCKGIGLKPIAGGIGMSDDMDKVKEGLDKLNALEMQYAVCYWPWFVGPPFKLDNCKRSAEVLNKIGDLAKKKGLTFCWHNHDNEFIRMEEGLPFDYLMKHTDKDLVFCEMDIYWVKKGGADPLEVLKKYPGRIKILHVKDMADDADKTFECPGSGIIDFPTIFAEAHQQGIKHYFVERDNIKDGFACLKSSGKYLRELRF